MAKRNRAVSYLRVSGKGQVRGDGFPRQRKAVADYAKRHAIEVTKEFTDAGVSGTRELDNRPGLAALLDVVTSNGVNLVLVERADRLARDLLIGEIILSEFRAAGIKVIAADSGTDLTVCDDDPTRKLIRQVLGAVAEFEKSTLVLKLRAARQRARRQRGRCEGRKPFGERASEQATIERIRELRHKPRERPRMSWRAVATMLDTEGRPTRTGRSWDCGALCRIAKRHGIS